MAEMCAFVPTVGFRSSSFVGSRAAVRSVSAARTPTRKSVRWVGPVMKTVGEVSADSFQGEVMESDVPVLVDFYATWCGPCKLVAPVMDWAATKYAGQLRVVKIDTEANPNFVSQYDIHGLPTLAVFKDGKNISQVEGAIGKDKVLDLLTEALPELTE